MSSQQYGVEIDSIDYDDLIDYDDTDDNPDDQPFSEPAPAGLIQDTFSNSINSMEARAKEAETFFEDI